MSILLFVKSGNYWATTVSIEGLQAEVDSTGTQRHLQANKAGQVRRQAFQVAIFREKEAEFPLRDKA